MKLTIKGLTKNYGKVCALSQFTYEFAPGIYGILGANGAGKSTLFGLLTDTVRRDSGEILWDGVDILKLGREYRAKVGYMPQGSKAKNGASADRGRFVYLCKPEISPFFLWYASACTAGSGYARQSTTADLG